MRAGIETPRRGVSTTAALLLAAFAIVALTLACGSGDSGAVRTPPGFAPPSLYPVYTVNPADIRYRLTFSRAGGGEVDLYAERADTPEQRSRGLMFRDSLPEGAGMLFDFGGQTQSGFWMKNTTVPLSIAFIAANGGIIDIQDMEPLSEQLHYPAQPYLWAVEANQGWFERKGVAVGDTVLIPGGSRAP